MCAYPTQLPETHLFFLFGLFTKTYLVPNEHK